MSGYMTRTGGGGGRPALKGNLALKSSPLNPSSGKSVSQDLVIDHMNAHYRKLLSAKSAIDSSVPKAYMSSQKVRDRQVRDSVLANGKKSSSTRRPMSARLTGIKPSSAHNSRPGSARARTGAVRASYQPTNLEPFGLEDADYQDFSQDEINCINAMVNDTIDSERLDRVLNGTAGQPPPGGKTTSRSGGSGSGGHRTSRGMTEAMSMNTLHRKNMSADILDQRNHVFSEPKGTFTPRTLRNPKYKDVPSKLSQTKHFRPAKTGSSPPVTHNQKGYAPSATESDILDETLMSRDFSTRMTMSGAVPKLDISIDQDHMKWLQEQSARHESKSYRPLDEELAGEQRHKPAGRNGFTKQKIQKEEEELAYLDFIGEVTNDVLTRGIFTNRVLRNVFEEHVQKNKFKLDEDRMRGMLDNLREDLGIPSHESYRDNPDDVGMGSSLPQVRSSSKTTGFTGDPSQFKNVRVGSLSREVSGSSRTSYGDVASHKVAGDQHLTKGEHSYNRTALNTNQSANPNDLQSLTDIVEVSEKTASVSSFHSKASIGKISSAHSEKNEEHKNMDDALVNLLGLDDVEDLQSDDKEDEIIAKPGLETMSVKSALSSHTSDRLSKKSSVDPLTDYADNLELIDRADKTSVHSTSSKSSKASTLRDKTFTNSPPKPLPRQSTQDSSKYSTSRQTSMESRNNGMTDDESTPVASPRRTPAATTNNNNFGEGSNVAKDRSQSPSSNLVESVYKTRPRRTSADSSYKASSEHRSVDGKHKSTSRQSSLDEEEREDLESNVDFGKTTMFAKTRNMDLTYKALSQVSDEPDDYSDNFSDEDF